jgi:hypothetical protein
MDDNITKILVGVFAALAGAIAAGLVNAYAASQKIKEVELGYIYKLREGYLENARKVAGDVYIPLSIALTTLHNEYDKFRKDINFEKNTFIANSRDAFRVECNKYLEVVDALMIRGADAYLTTELDERLQSFNSVLRQSIVESKVISRYVLRSNLSLLPIAINLPSFEYQASRAPGKNIRIPDISLRMAGIGFRYAEKILAAPLGSREFEQFILTNIPAIKFSIKEVTLGSR